MYLHANTLRLNAAIDPWLRQLFGSGDYTASAGPVPNAVSATAISESAVCHRLNRQGFITASYNSKFGRAVGVAQSTAKPAFQSIWSPRLQLMSAKKELESAQKLVAIA